MVRIKIDWKTARTMALERDQYKCVICGRKASRVHHLVRISPPDNRLDNLVSLCSGCQSFESPKDYSHYGFPETRRGRTITEKLKPLVVKKQTSLIYGVLNDESLPLAEIHTRLKCHNSIEWTRQIVLNLFRMGKLKREKRGREWFYQQWSDREF